MKVDYFALMSGYLGKFDAATPADKRGTSDKRLYLTDIPVHIKLSEDAAIKVRYDANGGYRIVHQG